MKDVKNNLLSFVNLMDDTTGEDELQIAVDVEAESQADSVCLTVDVEETPDVVLVSKNDLHEDNIEDVCQRCNDNFLSSNTCRDCQKNSLVIESLILRLDVLERKVNSKAHEASCEELLSNYNTMKEERDSLLTALKLLMRDVKSTEVKPPASFKEAQVKGKSAETSKSNKNNSPSSSHKGQDDKNGKPPSSHLSGDLSGMLKRTCKESISTSSAVPIARPCSPSVVQKCNSEETQKHDSTTVAQWNSFEIIHPQSPSVTQPCNSSVQPRKLQTARPHSPLFAQLPVSAPANQTGTDDNDAEEQQPPTSNPGASLPPLSSFMDSVQMSEILHAKNERKMTLAMLSILFERKVLSASSVTGKSKEGRPALDREKVQLIISHVSERFPTASLSVIKAAMAQKCKDARNATEARKTKAEKV